MTKIPDQLTESQAPGYLTDEQAHYWAMGYGAHQDELRDQLSDAHQRIFALEKERDDASDKAWEMEYLLKDILDIESELECIGGGPNWKQRRAKAYAAAWEKFSG